MRRRQELIADVDKTEVWKSYSSLHLLVGGQEAYQSNLVAHRRLQSYRRSLDTC